MPGGPASNEIRVAPALASRVAATSRSSTAARPTNGTRLAIVHRCHEAIAAAAHGRDHRTVAGITERAPQVAQRAGQRILAHRDPRPQLVEQLGLRHHAFAVGDEVSQEVAGLARDVDGVSGAVQLARRRREREPAKADRTSHGVIVLGPRPGCAGNCWSQIPNTAVGFLPIPIAVKPRLAIATHAPRSPEDPQIGDRPAR
jgi:hypothetical protein